jgi:GTPase SAR1 family protein
MFSSVTRGYYRGAGACVLVFATDDRASFDAIPQWHNAVIQECGTDTVFVLVQNKVDLLSTSNATPPDEVESLARTLNVKLYRTCVKDNVNVKDVFYYLADEFVRRGGHLSAENNTRHVATLDSYSIAASTANNDSHNNGAALAASNPITVTTSNVQLTDNNDENTTHSTNQKHLTVAGKVLKARGSITNSTNHKPSSTIGSDSSTPRTATPQQPHRTVAKTVATGGTLQPMTQRTGGKKKQECSVM